MRHFREIVFLKLLFFFSRLIIMPFLLLRVLLVLLVVFVVGVVLCAFFVVPLLPLEPVLLIELSGGLRLILLYLFGRGGIQNGQPILNLLDDLVDLPQILGR